MAPNNPYPNRYLGRFPVRNPNFNPNPNFQNPRQPIKQPILSQKIPPKPDTSRRKILIYSIIGVGVLILILLFYLLLTIDKKAEDFECADDAECDTGYLCEAGECILEVLGCSDDYDCDVGYFCQEGDCVVQEFECSLDSDCLTGEVCEDGICVASLPNCASDSDCSSGYICEGGDCILDTVDSGGNLCQNGTTRKCGSDVGECVKGNQTCTNGVWGNCTGAVNPANETCDSKDNDCDGVVDEGNICDLPEDGVSNFSWGFAYEDIRTGFSAGEGVYVAGYARNYSTPEPAGGVAGNYIIPYLTKGTIIGGPNYYTDPSWWKIRWGDGLLGWSAGSSSNNVFLEKVSGGSSLSVGDSVKVRNGIQGLGVRSIPSESFNSLDSKGAGEGGIIIAGPDKNLLRSGYYIWWKVNFTGLGETWISEDKIGKANDMPSAVSTKFVGWTNVTLNKTEDIRLVPNSNLIILGSKTLGTNVTIAGSPHYVNGEWWWRINFKENVPFFGEQIELIGWVRESSLYVSQADNFSLGVKIRVKNNTINLAVRETPSQSATWYGGKSTGATGNISGGPEFNESYYWWKIKWEGGLEGWSVANFIELSN